MSDDVGKLLDLVKPGAFYNDGHGLPDGTVVVSGAGEVFQRRDGWWHGALSSKPVEHLSLLWTPYTPLYLPDGTQIPATVLTPGAGDEEFAEEIKVSGSALFIDGHRFPWFVEENPQIVPRDGEIMALQIFIPTTRVTIQSTTSEGS